jgi:RNA polymerase sigma factor (sigma-70 family)
MPKAIYDDVLRFLHHACGLKGGGDKPDRELVERYLGHEEAAFSLLMQRHGPMILGICRRLAADPHSAEDGFQATFMVLIREAAAIRKKESLAPWLHGVARRLVLKARAKAAANRRREERTLPMASPDPLQELTVRELRSCLDEEIAQLPVKYQTPILLCYFEGKSYSQAAQEIGCPKSTFTNRLNRGLELLRRQLSRRGITLAGAALATTLTEAAAAPPLPAILAVNTMKAATLLGGSKAVACGCLTATALALAEEALTGMLLVKGKIVLMVLALGLAVGGVGWAGYKELAETGRLALRGIGQAPVPKKQAEISAKEKKVVAKDENLEKLPEGAVARLGMARFSEVGRPFAISYSLDGKTLVAGSWDGAITVWDFETRKVIREWDSHSDSVRAMALSPDGNRLATAGRDSEISVWDMAQGELLKTLEGPKETTNLLAYCTFRKNLSYPS